MHTFNVLLALGVGLAFTGHGLWLILLEIRRMQRIRSWCYGTGSIISSSVLAKDDAEGTAYDVQVVYQYLLGGSMHQARAKLLPTRVFTQEEADGLCAHYPIGRQLAIVFNPNRVEQSEIADDVQVEPRGRVITTGLLQLGFGLFWLISVLR